MASRSPYWPPSPPPRRGSAPNRGCTATTAQGKPCGSPALRDERFCNMHHPDHAAEVAEARRLGGVRHRKEATLSAFYDLGDPGSIEGAIRLLHIAALETLALDNSVARNRTLVAVASASVRVIEAAELAARIAALESALGLERERGRTDEPIFPEREP
jgi:hypothetical protein